MENQIIAWWSAGVTSAIATKLAIEKYGKNRVVPIYFKIDSAHEDNARFLEQCQNWYDVEIRIERAKKYKDQFEVIKGERYINGPSGAKCTTILKKQVRQRIEKDEEYDAQVFGFEYVKKEVNRAIRFKEQYPSAKPIFPLIEAKMNKIECLHFLEDAGIKRPVMYDLGYSNNNCIGCVKGGMGYWNKIREDFPDHFNKMVELEDHLNRSCIKGTFLKDLDPERGRQEPMIMPDCGNFCEIEFTDIIHKEIDSIMDNPVDLLGAAHLLSESNN